MDALEKSNTKLTEEVSVTENHLTFWCFGIGHSKGKGGVIFRFLVYVGGVLNDGTGKTALLRNCTVCCYSLSMRWKHNRAFLLKAKAAEYTLSL